MISLRYADVEYTPEGCQTIFRDGSAWGCHPHPGSPLYHVVAHRCGYGEDLLRYAREHDVAHSVVAEYFDQPSQVLWALAHKQVPSAYDAASEEALVLCLQKLARLNEEPHVDRIDWRRLRERFLAVVENAQCSA